MLVEKSPLILEEVFIIASNLISIPSPEGSTTKVNDFDIDVDFNIFNNLATPDAKKVVVSVSGNNPENPVPGYSFSVVAQGVFKYDPDVKVKKKDRDFLITHSAIPILIGQIRSYITTLTALGPYGSYVLPGINMNHLLAVKSRVSLGDQPA